MMYNETGVPSQIMQLASVLRIDTSSRRRIPDALHQPSSPGISIQVNPARVYRRSSCAALSAVVNSDEKHGTSLQLYRRLSYTPPKTEPPDASHPQLSYQTYSANTPSLRLVSPPPVNSSRPAPRMIPTAARNNVALSRAGLCEEKMSMCRNSHCPDLTSQTIQASLGVIPRIKEFKASSKGGCDTTSLSNGQRIAIPMLARLDCDVPSWIEPPDDTLAAVQSCVCDPTAKLESSVALRPHDYEHTAIRSMGDATNSKPLLFMTPLGLQKVASQEGRASSGQTSTEDCPSSSHVDPWSCRYLLPASSESKDTGNSQDDTSSSSVLFATQRHKDVTLQCNELSGPAAYSRSMLERIPAMQKRIAEDKDLNDMVEPSIDSSGVAPHSRSVLESLEVVHKRLADNRDLYDMVEKLCPQKLKRSDSDTDAPATSDSEAISGISGDEDESTKHLSISPASRFIK